MLTNNIDEGSVSIQRQETIQFLNLTRRSLFKDASMLPVFEQPGLITNFKADHRLQLSDKLSGKLTHRAR